MSELGGSPRASPKAIAMKTRAAQRRELYWDCMCWAAAEGDFLDVALALAGAKRERANHPETETGCACEPPAVPVCRVRAVTSARMLTWHPPPRPLLAQRITRAPLHRHVASDITVFYSAGGTVCGASSRAPISAHTRYHLHCDTCSGSLSRDVSTRPLFVPDTALMLSAKNGHQDIVHLLLDCEADPDVVTSHTGDKFSALMWSAYNGDADITLLLLAHGANPATFRPDNGWTALMSACNRDQPRCAKILLDAGADPSQSLAGTGGTVLMCVRACPLSHSTDHHQSTRRRSPLPPKRAGANAWCG